MFVSFLVILNDTCIVPLRETSLLYEVVTNCAESLWSVVIDVHDVWLSSKQGSIWCCFPTEVLPLLSRRCYAAVTSYVLSCVYTFVTCLGNCVTPVSNDSISEQKNTWKTHLHTQWGCRNRKNKKLKTCLQCFVGHKQDKYSTYTVTVVL